MRSGANADALASAPAPSEASIMRTRSSSSVARTRSTTCGSSSAMRIVTMTFGASKACARAVASVKLQGSAVVRRRTCPAERAACPLHRAAGLLDLDGPLHRGMQPADVLEGARRVESHRVALPLEQDRRAL